MKDNHSLTKLGLQPAVKDPQYNVQYIYTGIYKSLPQTVCATAVRHKSYLEWPCDSISTIAVQVMQV